MMDKISQFPSTLLCRFLTSPPPPVPWGPDGASLSGRWAISVSRGSDPTPRRLRLYSLQKEALPSPMRNLLQIQGPGMKTSRVPGSGFCSHRVITYLQQNPCHRFTMDNVPTSQTGAHAMLLQLCLTLCDLIDHSLPGSSVHGVLQARMLESVTIPSPRGSFPPRD